MRSVHEELSAEKSPTTAGTPRNIRNASFATVSIVSRKLRHRTARDFAQNSSTKRTPMLCPIASSCAFTSAGLS
jgi:hypothetical protein